MSRQPAVRLAAAALAVQLLPSVACYSGEGEYDSAAVAELWGGAAVDLDAPDAPVLFPGRQAADGRQSGGGGPAEPQGANEGRGGGGTAEQQQPQGGGAEPVDAQPDGAAGAESKGALAKHRGPSRHPHRRMLSKQASMFRRLGPDVLTCHEQGACEAALAACEAAGPQDCLQARIGLQRLRYAERHGARGIDEVDKTIPTAHHPTEKEWEDFYNGPVFRGVWTRFDKMPGMVAVRSTVPVYPNISVESGLAFVGCDGPEYLPECIADVHALLRMVGHEGDSGWELWNRLGVLWRSAGHAKHAVMSFRKALYLQPDQPDVLFNMACALKHAHMREDALLIVDECSVLGLLYSVTKCELLVYTDPREARQCIAELLQQHPDYQSGWDMKNWIEEQVLELYGSPWLAYAPGPAAGAGCAMAALGVAGALYTRYTRSPPPPPPQPGRGSKRRR
eukprot:TRINITY_DN16148_c0_g1_i1.p1 TRINITY_DN16148_c0_g1~~TRINITY_DN16148_c0_g1_i1.p1  ORF type:complete len:450 (+),score=113.16 TRINITY_DN16148_c0_g1_i1:93-1442(+)